MDIPLYAYDLIKLLDKQYPEKTPEGHEAERELWMTAGERRLVNRLLHRMKQEEETQYQDQPIGRQGDDEE